MPVAEEDGSEIIERLARIEEQFKSLNGWMRDHIQRADHLESVYADRIGEDEKRLSSLELWRARIGGFATGIGILSGVVTAIITALIMRLIG